MMRKDCMMSHFGVRLAGTIGVVVVGVGREEHLYDPNGL